MFLSKGVVNTIRLIVEVSDLDGGESKILTLPCNLRSELEDYYNYIILSTTPDIPISRNDNIQELNDILDEINSENPGMTEEYLGVLFEASPSGDLFDENFVRKLKENEFMFEDISGVRWAMSAEETAGRYMATELQIPFDHGITKDMLEIVSDDVLVDYINWEQVWEQYASLGFKLIERAGLSPAGYGGSIARGRYIVHIK